MIFFKPESTSPFIIASFVTPLIIIECFKATKSSQPHLLGRPVVAPNSLPTCAILFPISSCNSVGKGPLPTLVVYALKIPITSLILFGAIPKPVHAPAAVVVDEVTKGYVPKSISSNDP